MLSLYRQGSSSTIDELTASAFLTVELDKSLGGNAVQVTSCRHTLIEKKNYSIVNTYTVHSNEPSADEASGPGKKRKVV